MQPGETRRRRMLYGRKMPPSIILRKKAAALLELFDLGTARSQQGQEYGRSGEKRRLPPRSRQVGRI